MVKVKSRLYHDVASPLNQHYYQMLTFCTCMFYDISPDKMLKAGFTITRSRPHNDISHVHPKAMSPPSMNFEYLTAHLRSITVMGKKYILTYNEIPLLTIIFCCAHGLCSILILLT